MLLQRHSQPGCGAFLIPYVIMLVLSGIPLFFMESSLGQFASLGPVLVWRVVPIVQGVGITMVLISTLVSIYYNVIVAYSLYYLFASFQKILPWSDCFEWADKMCSKHLKDTCNTTSGANGTLSTNFTSGMDDNVTCIINETNAPTLELPSKQYWDKVALRRSRGLDDTGVVLWHLTLCNLLAWILVAAALYKGIKSSGKVVYFTAVFPYVVLLILLVRGATLEGAGEGIAYYIGAKSNVTKLYEAEVWKDAATQIFYSYCIAWGGLATYSSYNKFHNNCFLDSVFVCIINGLTSLLAGFTIFSILGHMAHVLDTPVSKVADAGFGLAFVAYPEALTKLPISPLWSILFFFMLLTLGFDSQFSNVEILTTSIQDAFPNVMKRFRIYITSGCCMVLFLLGIPCVTQAGIYWVNLIDYYCGGWTLLIAALIEVLAISWIYGANSFIKDIEMMIGKKHWIFWLWWRACWFFLSPAVITAILIWSLATFETPTYGTVVYPTWGEAMGWCMIVFCIMWIPVVAVYKIVKAEGNILQRIIMTCKPAPNWGPALAANRGERYKHMMTVTDKENNNVEIPTVHGSLSGCDNAAYL
ncbi:sodium- and chloride-dependent neutral and basic amino acid transporter B(0+)-like isoform X2 [Ambystoma mexicanum]|uniref:sodium- and chloride-dependent neutral and basic amino acid transporter B(0+)-like isoform X2 n=1 Tax=Ambystoma mexicanum TaxID=8296 RepID=UPI0037E80C46